MLTRIVEVLDNALLGTNVPRRARLARRIAELGDTPLALSGSEFAKLIADETEKWGSVIRAANVKAE